MPRLDRGTIEDENRSAPDGERYNPGRIVYLPEEGGFKTRPYGESLGLRRGPDASGKPALAGGLGDDSLRRLGSSVKAPSRVESIY